jgi:hypothetical protein
LVPTTVKTILSFAAVDAHANDLVLHTNAVHHQRLWTNRFTSVVPTGRQVVCYNAWEVASAKSLVFSYHDGDSKVLASSYLERVQPLYPQLWPAVSGLVE